jgi:phage-related protein
MANIIDITIRALDQTGSGVASAGKAGNFLAGIFQGIGQKAAGMVAELPSKAISFFSDAIGAASDLGETVSKNQTIFGAASKELLDWAENAPRSLGLTKQAALDATGTLGNLFTQLGITTDEARKMSQANVQLATDFASFHNADPTEVLEAMTAAYRGEYDAVQRYVPVINAAKVEEEALAQTHKKSAKELTEKDKALAVSSLMQKNAGAAAGDFARTSDSAANKTRIAAAAFEDLKVKIGNALLPTWSALLSFVTGSFLPMLSNVADAVIGKVGPAFQIASDALKLFVGAFTGEGADIQSDLGGWMNTIIDWGATARGVFDSVMNFFGQLKAGWDALVSAFQTGMTENESGWGTFSQIMEQVGLIARTVFEWLQSNVPNILATLQGALAPLVGKLQEFWDMIGGNQALLVTIGVLIGSVVLSAVLALTGALWSMAAAVLAATWPLVAIVAVIFAVVAALMYAYNNWEWFRNGIATVVGWLQTNVPPAFEMVKAAVMVAFDWIANVAVPAVMNAFNAFMGFLQGTLLPAVTTVWNGIWSSAEQLAAILIDVFTRISNFISDNWNWISGLARAVWDLITNIISNAWQIISNIIQLFLNIITGNWSGAWQNIQNILSAAWNMIVGVISGAASIIGNLFMIIVSAAGNLAAAVAGKVGELIGWFQRLPGQIMGAIAGLAGDMLAAGGRIIQSLIDGIRSKIGGAVDAVKGGLQSIRNLLPFSPAKEGPFSGRGWTLYSGQSMVEAIGEGFTSRRGSMLAAVRSTMEATQRAISAGTNLGGYMPGQPAIAAALAGAGGGTTVNQYIQGSIRSDRDLVRLIRDDLDNLGLGPQRTGAGRI